MTLPTQNYHAAMELLYDDGQWYRLPRWIFKIKPAFPVKDKETNRPIRGKFAKHKLKTEAYLLAAILNQSAVSKAVHNGDGWFEFSAKKAEEDTGFSRDRQQDYLNILCACGLIQEGGRVNKIYGRRLLKVNYEELVQLMNEVLAEEQTTEQAGCLREKPASSCGKNPQAVAGKTRKPIYSIKNRYKNTLENPPPAAKTSSAAAASNKTNNRLSPDLIPQEKTYPQFCYELGKDMLKFFRELPQPMLNFQPGTVETRAKYFYAVYKKAGKNAQAQERICSLLAWYKENFHNTKLKLPRDIVSIKHLCKVLPWIEEEKTRAVTRQQQEQVKAATKDTPFFISQKGEKPILGVRHSDGQIEMFTDPFALAYAWEAIPAEVRKSYLSLGGEPPPPEPEEDY